MDNQPNPDVLRTYVYYVLREHADTVKVLQMSNGDFYYSLTVKAEIYNIGECIVSIVVRSDFITSTVYVGDNQTYTFNNLRMEIFSVNRFSKFIDSAVESYLNLKKG